MVSWCMDQNQSTLGSAGSKQVFSLLPQNICYTFMHIGDFFLYDITAASTSHVYVTEIHLSMYLNCSIPSMSFFYWYISEDPTQISPMGSY